MDAERGRAQQELSDEFITMVMQAFDDPDVPLEDRPDIAAHHRADAHHGDRAS